MGDWQWFMQMMAMMTLHDLTLSDELEQLANQ